MPDISMTLCTRVPKVMTHESVGLVEWIYVSVIQSLMYDLQYTRLVMDSLVFRRTHPLQLCLKLQINFEQHVVV